MKILLTTVLCLCLSLTAFADQKTTVLSQNINSGKTQIVLPYIDGSNDSSAEKQINALVQKTAEQLAKKVGGGKVTYKVMLNRPSMVSLLLEAENNGKHIYKGLNLDLTTGKEFIVTDFFVDNDEIKGILGNYNNVLFGEEGLYIRHNDLNTYDNFVAYEKVISYMRVGEAGRLMQIAKLTEGVSGKTLVLEKSGLIALKLAGNPSTGYSWHMVCDSDAISTVGSTFTIPGNDDNRVGTPGVEIIFLAAKKPGTYNVKMEYKRAWEKNSLENFTFTVIVK